MEYLSAGISWEELMDYVALVESLEDPWGRKGFFSVRTGRWLEYHHCIIEFHLETSPTSWKIEMVSNSYTPAPLRENIISALGQFISWYNKATG